MLSNKTEKENTNLIQDLETEEAGEFVNEVGILIFQSALTKYLAIASDNEAREFEAFMNLQINSEDFFEKIQKTYPDFGIFLEEEARALNDEMNSVVGSVKIEGKE